MKTISIAEQPKLLNELIEGLTQAIGACSQLTHTMQDPRWMTMREMVELAREGATLTATFEARKIRPKIIGAMH